MSTYKLHFIPLGGVVGVTKNMYVYELYKDEVLQDILIIDCGIGFPQEKELGVDFVIPDISYLHDKKDKIRAILLSHGHEDHTSALPYHYEDLGFPPIYTSKLTSVFVTHKFREFDIKINMNQIEYGKEYMFGEFKVSFIRMTHSIPDTMHILIKTPVGQIYHGPDFKLDLTPPYGSSPDFYEITKAGHDGILCLLSDCLGAERPGLTLSESIVGETFEDEMRKTKGKFIMTTFSSNISRIHQCVEAAVKFNRKIVFLGRSMKDNTRHAGEIGYLPIPDNFTLKEEDVMKLPPNKVCLIVAGSQGQAGSALSKLANKQNSNVQIKNGDTVMISSDPIPGNENEVYATIEDLTLQGANVIYSDIAEQLHSSGHGNQEDLKFLIRFTNPKYFIPIGGTVRHQKQYQKLAVEMGYNRENIFTLDEGETIWFIKNKAIPGDIVETKNIYVDAYGVGDIGNVVLRDRKTLSSDGIVFTLLIINKQGMLVTRPKIMSRGFVFDKEEIALFEKASQLIEKSMKPHGGTTTNVGIIKQNIIRTLEDFLFSERGRRPLVIVDTIEI
ncbi:MAG: ribonuclease J [bacterium]|nr:ribonuclease J [bacterium]